jgi:hypothetical protein
MGFKDIKEVFDTLRGSLLKRVSLKELGAQQLETALKPLKSIQK